MDIYTVVRILGEGMREQSIKSWMMGSNPRLKGKAPIEAIHDGRAYKVMGAAKAFVLHATEAARPRGMGRHAIWES